MGEVTKADSFAGAKPDANSVPAEQAAKLAEQAKSGVARAVVTSGEPAVPSERPKGLPEKFKTVEDMVKSYGELEKKLSGGGNKPADEKAPKGTSDLTLNGGGAPKTEGAPADQSKKAEEVVAKAGLDMAKLQSEFAQKGELAPESLKALEEVGITKDVVDLYIAGQQALNERIHSDIDSIAGGHEQFEQMKAWSERALSKTEQEAINKVVATGNPEAIKLAFQGVHAKWVAAGENEPTEQIRGATAEPAAGEFYRYRDEMIADMKKPEYKTSEAFRKKVEEKLARSNHWK